MRRLLALVAVAAGLVIGGASPASAHTGIGPTDAQATLDRVSPAVAGLVVNVRRGGRVEVVNRTGRSVVVAGYEGEPYLQLDKGVVRRNVRSPATAINASARGGGDDPAADAKAPPRWQVVGRGDRWSWHDHRLHWMQPAPDHPQRRQLLAHWDLALRVDGRPVTASGRIVWVPGPSSLPYAAAALAALAGLGVLAVVAGALPGLVIGLTLATGAGAVVWAAAGGPLVVIAAVVAAVALLALVALPRSRPLAVQGAALAGLAVAVAAGAVQWRAIGRSDPAVHLTVTLYRVAVGVALGTGLGVAGIGVWRTARVPIGAGSTARPVIAGPTPGRRRRRRP